MPDRIRTKWFAIDPDYVELTSEHTSLTQREREIIALVAEGCSTKAIARKMQISSRTVERFIENCRFKLHAKNKSQLVSRAMSDGHLLAD